MVLGVEMNWEEKVLEWNNEPTKEGVKYGFRVKRV